MFEQPDIDGDALAGEFTGDGLTAWNWGLAAIVLVVAIIASRIVKVIIVRLLRRRADPALSVLVGRMIGYVILTYGDQVEINNHEGTVHGIDTRLVTPITPDGESIASFWATRSAVALSVNEALEAAGITIPFPQRTMWWVGDTAD